MGNKSLILWKLDTETPSLKCASFVYDDTGSYYFVGSGGGSGGYGLSIKSDVKIKPQYLIGLLNSKLLDFMVKKTSTRFSGGFFAYNKQYIGALPIILPVGKNREQMANQITDLVEKISTIKNRINENDSFRGELAESETNLYEEKIDQLVYKLYGITEEEKKVIEESLT